MLEEALRDEKGRNPSETALAMLNFLQCDLAPGGAAADARLCNNLFGPLCERIFGPMDELTYQHASGAGWLSAPTRWARASASATAAGGGATADPSSSSSTLHRHGLGLSSPAPSTAGGIRSTPYSSSSSSGSHWELDPVVRLLATANRAPLTSSSTSPAPASSSRREPSLPTLVEAISGESENRPSAGFAFPFLALPKVTQDAYMEVLEMTMHSNGMPASAFGSVGSGFLSGRSSSQDPSTSLLTDNDMRLFGALLNRSPRDQPGLQRWRLVLAQRAAAQQRKQPSPQHQQPQQFRTSSPMNLYQGGFPSRSFQGGPATPVAARILSPGGPFGGGGGGGAIAPNNAAAKRDESKAVTIILSMLEYYLLLFVRFPTALAPPSTTSSSTNYGRSASGSANVQSIYTPFGEMVYNYLFARYVAYFLPYEAQDDNGTRCIVVGTTKTATTSELFLRLCVSLWLEAPVRPIPTTAAVTSLADQRDRTTGLRQENQQFTSAAEKRSFDYSLELSFDLVQTNQAFTPPSSHVKSCLRKLLIHVLSDPSLRTAIFERASAPVPPGTANSKTNAESTLVNHALWTLQAPLYNYVRVAFRHASIHAKDSAFFSALDLWLLYLEPWNVIRAKSINPGARHQPVRFNLVVPRYSDASRFDRNWEPFVAANLHMYLTPLAIFLRRSRELDFSPRKFDFSLKVVKRVIRVFSPALLRALDESPHRHSQLFQQHVERLDKFAPPLAADVTLKASAMLRSCQPDMHSLLEEVHMQHLKKVRDLDVIDRLGAWFEGIFGMGVIQGEEKELQDLVARATGVVGFPSTYQVFPKGVQAAATATAPGDAATTTTNSVVIRTSDGLLTEQGRALIVEGRAKCNPADVSFVGDKMYASVRPHELKWLVLVLVHLSEVLNGKLGWSSTTMVRINLRFLADYRNLLATVLTLYIVCKFIL